MKLVWSPLAQESMAAALDDIAQDNPQAALGQWDQIERQADMLLDHPEMGRKGRVADTRELVISRTPFLLVYRLTGKVIEIVTFLHGSQLWPPAQK